MLTKKLLHYTGKALADFNMIQTGDRVLVAVSGGKDSYTLVHLLHKLQIKTQQKFTIHAIIVNQSQPNWDVSPVGTWLAANKIPYEVVQQNIYGIVQDKIAPRKNPCSFCSRLRRGVIYSYAKKHGFKKIALGHHRDDLIESLLMSILYSGEIRSQPPKLLTNDCKHIVIRPLAYCQERDILEYANLQQFPVIACGDCGRKDTTRTQVKALIQELAKANPKVPSNILHALQGVRLSQLMDQQRYDFKHLEEKLL